MGLKRARQTLLPADQTAIVGYSSGPHLLKRLGESQSRFVQHPPLQLEVVRGALWDMNH